jgi:hypothetical protein
MRWWTAGWMVAGVVALAACSASPGNRSAGAPSENHSMEPTTSSAPPASPVPAAPPSTRTQSPTGPSPSAPAPSSSPSATGCVAGQTEITITPSDPPRRQLCARPGTTVSRVLQPRTDHKRWKAVHSSAPIFVLVSGWRVDADGTAHASLRCAGTRGGSAIITALAKAPAASGSAHGVFALDMTVIHYARER